MVPVRSSDRRSVAKYLRREDGIESALPTELTPRTAKMSGAGHHTLLRQGRCANVLCGHPHAQRLQTLGVSPLPTKVLVVSSGLRELWSRSGTAHNIHNFGGG